MLTEKEINNMSVQELRFVVQNLSILNDKNMEVISIQEKTIKRLKSQLGGNCEDYKCQGKKV